MIKEEIEKLLNEAAKKAGVEDTELKVSFSKLPEICDLQCNDCFALAKKLGKNPLELAQLIANSIKNNDLFEIEAVKPAFINIKITEEGCNYYANLLNKDERLGVEKISNQKVLLDYGGANVAKALHVGHLRPAIIGESLKRLYKFLGEEVISDVHLGDFGLQMGLTELQLFEEGKLDGYFNGGAKKTLTLEDLNEAYPRANIRKKSEEDFKAKAEEWTVFIQQKKEPYYEIYKVIRELSVKEIKENYSKLGANFDLWYGESTANEYCDKIISILEDKGLLKESDGIKIVEVAQEGENIAKVNEKGEVQYLNPMPPCLIKKANGAVLYPTTDIATIYMRNQEFENLDRIEYVTDARQKMHFTQVFRVCKKSEISPENQQLVHIVHGTMNGKDGKPFKTRSGDTIKLEDIISMLTEGATKKLKENGVADTEKTALKIGVGAMKFGDLSNSIAKDYVFDLDKFLSFEGKTGPYIQYTICRINSILEKATLSAGQIQITDKEEKDVFIKILKLNSSYEICYKEKSLNNLCLAAFDLASAFSTFYNNHRILTEKNEDKQRSYLALLQFVKKALVQALDILAIEIPDKM